MFDFQSIKLEDIRPFYACMSVTAIKTSFRITAFTEGGRQKAQGPDEVHC